MQAPCPSCSHTISIDDARVPNRPFSVKCPKCQGAVKFPGKTAAAPAAMQAPEPIDDTPVRPIANGERALLGLPDAAETERVRQVLTQLGYSVEILDSPEEGARLLEQGLFPLVITNRAQRVPGATEGMHQRIARLSSEARRRIFLVLVGEEFRTGDGAQAFAAMADLVVNPQNLGQFARPLASAIEDRKHLYQAFLDARRRHEEAAG